MRIKEFKREEREVLKITLDLGQALALALMFVLPVIVLFGTVGLILNDIAILYYGILFFMLLLIVVFFGKKIELEKHDKIFELKSFHFAGERTDVIYPEDKPELRAREEGKLLKGVSLYLVKTKPELKVHTLTPHLGERENRSNGLLHFTNKEMDQIAKFLDMKIIKKDPFQEDSIWE